MILSSWTNLSWTVRSMRPGRPSLLLDHHQLLLHLQLPGQLGAHLLHGPLELLQLLLVHLDPLAAVGDCGVLQESPEHHGETECQVNVQGLHV